MSQRRRALDGGWSTRLSVNWSPRSLFLDRSEVALFWGARYVAGEIRRRGHRRVEQRDRRRFPPRPQRHDRRRRRRHRPRRPRRRFSLAWSAGPSLGFTPFENGWLSVGWNLAGFHDRDFEEARYTRSGPYVRMRFKFDQLTLQSLGLGGR
jgi:hypothetical protein